jgi:uncharacterized protein YdcH (DUF465 family)
LKDSEISEILKKENEEFKKLEGEHKLLKQNLSEINKKKTHSTEQEMNKKNMQKQKLKIKDLMAEMIRKYKKNQN